MRTYRGFSNTIYPISFNVERCRYQQKLHLQTRVKTFLHHYQPRESGAKKSAPIEIQQFRWGENMI
jgi:hypothetical protein